MQNQNTLSSGNQNSFPMYLYKPESADKEKISITGWHLTGPILMQKLQLSGIHGVTVSEGSTSFDVTE